MSRVLIEEGSIAMMTSLRFFFIRLLVMISSSVTLFASSLLCFRTSVMKCASSLSRVLSQFLNDSGILSLTTFSFSYLALMKALTLKVSGLILSTLFVS